MLVEPSIQMESLTVDGQRAAESKMGERSEFIAEVDLVGKRSVLVKATATGGVVVQESFPLADPQAPEQTVGTVQIPARVEFSVRSSRELSELKFANERVPLARSSDGATDTYVGTWEKNVFDEQMQASVTNGVNRDSAVLRPQRGKRLICMLVLDPSARFTVRSERMSASGAGSPGAFGEVITFDAGESLPNDIDVFEWDFGDGQTERTTKPLTTHTYLLSNAASRSQTFPVQLRVLRHEAWSEVSRQDCVIELMSRAPVLSVKSYPSLSPTLSPGQQATFRVALDRSSLPGELASVEMDFGDGTKTKVDARNQPLASVLSHLGSTAIVAHSYTNRGRYRIGVKFRYATPLLPGEFEAEVVLADLGGSELVVSAPMSTDEELARRAWQDAMQQVPAFLSSAGFSKTMKLALSALRQPNFEGTGTADDRAVDRFTNFLVLEGYTILERDARALARLAPESVVDIRSELESGKVAGDSEEIKYRKNLDYGLRVDHSDDRPIHYSIALEGVADRLTQITNAASDQGLVRELSTAQAAASTGPQAWDNSRQAEAWRLLKNMPVLVARFATADRLLAVEVMTKGVGSSALDCAVETSPADHYDTVLDCPAVQRTATVALHVRLLKQDGSILKAVDIRGKASEQVPSFFVEAARDRTDRAGSR